MDNKTIDYNSTCEFKTDEDFINIIIKEECEKGQLELEAEKYLFSSTIIERIKNILIEEGQK